MALESTAESPVPVRTVARLIAEWIGRLGRVWVEGQVTELSRRPGMGTVFLTLRDPVADVSLRVTCPRGVYDGLVPPLAEGARVVVHARPEVHLARGSLSLSALEIRPVGVGDLLARLERLKALLAAEGMFADSRKRRPPVLPRCIGLITGRASAAERDVVDNASRRWPAVQFRLIPVAVQGPQAALAITAAVRELDRDTGVDVIVIARGGGSVEDLLPFSDEGLLRAVSACATPVVSAIGHEQDSPLLDLVADVRCSTPTDAGRRLVPHAGEEAAALDAARQRMVGCLTLRLRRERDTLAALRSRPCLADPGRGLEERRAAVVGLAGRGATAVQRSVDQRRAELVATEGRLRALSPAATLNRGYAVLQTEDGAVVRGPDEVHSGQPLRALVARGGFDVTVGPDR